MIRILSLIIANILLCTPCFATEGFSLYFVRHAEKMEDDKNPNLTRCGKARAKQLATLLSSANIKSIYSTDYQRTMSTAMPLAKQNNVAIKNYSPKHLKQFSLQLILRSEDSLVVGHSNTTPQLVRLLTNEKVDNIAEDEFQILYQIHFVNNEPFLTKLIQPLSCN